MRLAFVDFVYFYDAARPDSDEPLGGTTSAVCFLARALTAAGVECVFFNRVPAECEAYGIVSRPLQSLADELGQGRFDAYIFCGRWSDGLLKLVRANTTAPLIGWMHESLLGNPMTPACDEFDGMVFVSEWQQRVNQTLCKPHWQQAVIRNAMNPAVAASFATGAILPAKAEPPVLLFAGSFARGTFHIPPILDRLRTHRIDFTVELYCNLDPSREAVQDAAYIGWLRGLPNIAHVGMVGQGELARRMRRASLFLAPNTWPETSCIALIEALASGMQAVTTDRAALPETAAGFATHIAVEGKDEPMRFDMRVDYDAFAAAVIEAMTARDENPAQLEVRLRSQIDYLAGHYQWRQRAGEWFKYLDSTVNN